MKVYIVRSFDRYSGYTQIYGVYSSKKKADEEVERLEKDYGTHGVTYDWTDYKVE